MNNHKIYFEPIGIIHSPHKELSKTPIQPVFCEGIEGRVILNEQHTDGLKGLQGFSHIYLFFFFNQSKKTSLRVNPYLSDEEQGVFATRAPHRPNKIGMSLVGLVKIEGNILHVRNIDILDGTPLLDIKPYIRRYDTIENARSGWQEAISDGTASVRGLRDYKNKKKGVGQP